MRQNRNATLNVDVEARFSQSRYFRLGSKHRDRWIGKQPLRATYARAAVKLYTADVEGQASERQQWPSSGKWG